MNLLKIYGVLAVACITLSCNDSSTTPAPCTPISDATKNIELVYPTGGESLKLGTTVKVQWKVNKAKVSQVVLQISSDEKKNWIDILPQGVSVSGSSDFACMEESWKIGSESQAVSYITTGETQVYIRIANYDGKSDNAISSVIKVIP